ncbi:MAG: class I SAM-dependent methyltransferase [Rhizobiaceae bacterium]
MSYKKISKNAPKNCHLCEGMSQTAVVVNKFSHTDYGHLVCRKCGITFDSNVNDYLSLTLEADDIRNIKDEDTYRKYFVETSQIASDQGEVYSDFNWENNKALKFGVARHVLNAIDRHSVKDGRQSILDLGCGNGFTAVEIAKHNSLYQVTAVDPSPSVLGVNGIHNIRAIQGTLDSLRFNADSFDVVVIIGNLMLHNNPQLTIREARRILKPQGTLVMDFKNADTFIRRLIRYSALVGMKSVFPRSIVERSFVNMRFGFRKDYIRTVLRNTGFREIEVYSKPPRLLEFANKTGLQSGIKGILWRLTDQFDLLLDQRAWVQMIWRNEK